MLGSGSKGLRTVTAKIQNAPKQLRIGALVSIPLVLLVFIYLLHISSSGPVSTSKTSSSSAAHTSSTKSSDTQSGQQSNDAKTDTKPAAGTNAVKASSVAPSAILNLTDWKLTLPIGGSHDPDEITQPELASFSLSPYFQTNSAQNGVVFQAPISGVTTSGSKFPRSELREMTNNGAKEASWSTNQGTSTLTLRESIDHLPDQRPQVVAAQIHGPSEYVILVRLNGNDLFVEGNGKNLGDLDKNYKLGTAYDLQVKAENGHIFVSYNGSRKVDYLDSSAGNYFKAGCYTQSNPSYGENSSSYGQTTIYSLDLSHT